MKQGAMIIQAVTQKNVLDKNGMINSDTLEVLLSNVCVNGIPMRNLLHGEKNKDTERQAVDLIAGYLAMQMDEKREALEVVSVISNGKHIPLSYIPPRVPEITTKVNLFSSRETKAAHEREILAHEEGLKRQEIWKSRNKHAAQVCQSYGKYKKKPSKERMSFSELANEHAVRTTFKDKDLNNSKKLEKHKSI